MDRVDRPALRGTLLGNALRLWNPVMRRLLRSPLHMPLSRWFAVIEWQGRKTGRTYDTPVSCLIEDDRLLITTGDRWCANFDGGARVKVWVRGRKREGTAESVRDQEPSLALHQHTFSRRPIFARLAGISPVDDRQLIAHSIRSGRTMVVVHLEE